MLILEFEYASQSDSKTKFKTTNCQFNKFIIRYIFVAKLMASHSENKDVSMEKREKIKGE